MKGAAGKMVVGNILSTAVVRHGDALALYCAGTGRRFSFKDVDARVNRLSNALLELGFKKGDVVAFLSTNRAELVEIYFALSRTGIVGLPINYRFAPKDMLDLMRMVGAVGLIYEGQFVSVAQSAAPELRRVVQFGAPTPDFAVDYETLLAASPTSRVDVEIEESDPFYFNLTSGTTGQSKSYILTQYNNSTLGPMFQCLDVNRQDVAMTVFPAFGRVGFAWIAGSMLYGIPNVLANFEPHDVLRLVETEGVTIFNVVPTMAAMLISAQAQSARDLRSLRAIVFAGSLLPETIREQTRSELCADIYEYYGMQETGLLVLSTPRDRAKSPYSVGKVVPFSEVRVVDDDGKDVAPNAIGEIIGRSPGAVVGYFNNPNRSAETFRNGWVYTGDLGSLDNEGYLTIRGRKKDMIVSGGQNVYAGEVEEALLKHPQIGDCAVFGLPDELWGECVTAVVIAKEGDIIDPAELAAFCRSHLASYSVPKRFIFDDQPLPRTPTGKVQKFLLAERIALQTTSPTE